jgi:nicotinate-nucleotide adenylyltransferase
MTKKIITGIFGGSFNPIHDGHLEAAINARKALGLDEVLLMVTPGSPLKDPSSYAPLEDRVKMCQMVAKPHQSWLKVTDIEKSLKTVETAHTLKALSDLYPDRHFIWIMGADNLRDFHNWKDWKNIIDNYPIAVLSRKGDTKASLESKAAKYAQSLKRSDPKDLLNGPGWYLMNNKVHHPYHSSAIVKSIHKKPLTLNELFNELSLNKKTQEFKDVAQHIIKKQLYQPKGH